MGIKKTAALLAAVAIAAVAGPATATPPWVVVVGAQTTGQVPFSAYTKAPIQFVVNNGSLGAPMSCGAAAAAGTIYPGNYPTGLAVAKIEGIAWSKCITFGGLQLNAYQAVDSKWALNLTSTSGPNWGGYINQINWLFRSKIVGVCQFDVTGRMNTTFNTAQVAGNNNYTQTLTINQPNTVPNLVVSNASGCLGVISNGQSMSFNGSFKVFNSVGLISIS